MGWKSKLMEAPVGLLARRTPSLREPPKDPEAIFVLRNNDIGDLLVITPLFEALHRRFPAARLTAGIGDWNRDVLAHNPYVTDTLLVNAPWNNKFTAPQRPADQLRYVRHSAEVRAIREAKFDIGIDILGSHVGALLLMQARIPYRLGVRGYRGGHSAMQQNVVFDEEQHASRAALQFAVLLGAQDLPEPRPQLFLTPDEKKAGEYLWAKADLLSGHARLRLVIGPGGGLAEKCWPKDRFRALIEKLCQRNDLQISMVGGPQDQESCERLIAGLPHTHNLAGRLSLRETFSLVQAADAVISNSSMLMHVAAAFSLPSVVLLSDVFSSAKHHELGWGYPGTCRILGREEEQSIATMEEAFAVVQQAIAQGAERKALHKMLQ